MDEAVTMLADRIEPGDHVWWQQGPSEAITLVDGLLALCEERVDEDPVHAFSGLSLNPRFGDPLPAGLELQSVRSHGQLRSVARAGRLGIVPVTTRQCPGSSRREGWALMSVCSRCRPRCLRARLFRGQRRLCS